MEAVKAEIVNLKKKFRTEKMKKQKNTAMLVAFEEKRNQDLRFYNEKDKENRKSKNKQIKGEYEKALKQSKDKLMSDIRALDKERLQGIFL